MEEIWSGKIPIVVTMDPFEVTAPSPPRPFYAMLPRVSYLPAYIGALLPNNEPTFGDWSLEVFRGGWLPFEGLCGGGMLDVPGGVMPGG